MQERMTAEQYRQQAATKPKANKHGAKKTPCNGVRYDSQGEAATARQLDFLQRIREIRSWTRQVPFRLPGGATHRVDFQVFIDERTFCLIEFKGRDLPGGKLRRRQVEELYKLTVHVIGEPREAWGIIAKLKNAGGKP